MIKNILSVALVVGISYASSSYYEAPLDLVNMGSSKNDTTYESKTTKDGQNKKEKTTIKKKEKNGDVEYEKKTEKSYDDGNNSNIDNQWEEERTIEKKQKKY